MIKYINPSKRVFIFIYKPYIITTKDCTFLSHYNIVIYNTRVHQVYKLTENSALTVIMGELLIVCFESIEQCSMSIKMYQITVNSAFRRYHLEAYNIKINISTFLALFEQIIPVTGGGCPQQNASNAKIMSM